jgi:hypothetical protein
MLRKVYHFPIITNGAIPETTNTCSAPTNANKFINVLECI